MFILTTIASIFHSISYLPYLPQYRHSISTNTSSSPESVQKNRLMRRDNISEHEAQSRMSSQMSIEEKKRLANVVIDNSGSLDFVYQQIDGIVLTNMSSWINTVAFWWLLFFPALWLYSMVWGLQLFYMATSWTKVKAKSVIKSTFTKKRE
jgi:hypothetical protein